VRIGFRGREASVCASGRVPVQIEEHGNNPESLGEGRGANGFPPTIRGSMAGDVPQETWGKQL
jgi:hypothetical protein